MKFRRIAVLLILPLLFLGGSASAAAAKGTGTSTSSSSTSSSSTTINSGGVQGYASDSVLQTGTIVQLASNSVTKVLPLSQKNIQQMYGVTVDQHQLPVTFSDSSLANEVFIATSGTYDVLVSTQAGVIKPNDYITISAIDGVGMNAGASGVTVLGRAINGFDGKNNVIGNTPLKDTSGHATKTVFLGIIPVAIDIQHNPAQKSTETRLPKSLQRIGEAVADKPVGPLRMYLSIAITAMSVIVAVVILYSGIRNGFISIGRNPLSRKSVFRGLLETILTGIIILIIGLFAVYLLLKL